MEAEHFCSIVAVSIPFFIVEILIIGEISISFHDVSNYLYLLCSELVNEG